eukprot:4718915-Lingulodinium_polyedra.AAC.1
MSVAQLFRRWPKGNQSTQFFEPRPRFCPVLVLSPASTAAQARCPFSQSASARPDVGCLAQLC